MCTDFRELNAKRRAAVLRSIGAMRAEGAFAV
jgi:hypothetical protein